MLNSWLYKRERQWVIYQTRNRVSLSGRATLDGAAARASAGTGMGPHKALHDPHCFVSRASSDACDALRR